MRREIIIIGLAIMVFQATLAIAASEPDEYDVFYDDQTSATLNRLTVNVPQIHTISGSADEDWACFPAQAGLPYAIKVRAVASGLDPELWVYPDGPAQPGTKTDYGSFGENEYYGLQRWPTTGLFYIKVRAAGIQASPTTYTLVVTCDVGANCGLASISGTIVKSAQANQDSLTLPKAVQLFDGTTTNPLYTLSQISYPSGAFMPDALPDLMLSGMGDPINNLNRPWVTKWHQRFPSNFSITRVGIHPAILPTTPINLTIQMRTLPLQRNLTDGLTTWPNTLMLDAAATDSPQKVRIYRWNAYQSEWIIYDPQPSIEKTSDCWLARTTIPQPTLDIFSSDFYGAAIESDATLSKAWMLFE